MAVVDNKDDNFICQPSLNSMKEQFNRICGVPCEETEKGGTLLSKSGVNLHIDEPQMQREEQEIHSEL